LKPSTTEERRRIAIRLLSGETAGDLARELDIDVAILEGWHAKASDALDGVLAPRVGLSLAPIEHALAVFSALALGLVAGLVLLHDGGPRNFRGLEGAEYAATGLTAAAIEAVGVALLAVWQRRRLRTPLGLVASAILTSAVVTVLITLVSWILPAQIEAMFVGGPRTTSVPSGPESALELLANATAIAMFVAQSLALGLAADLRGRLGEGAALILPTTAGCLLAGALRGELRGFFHEYYDVGPDAALVLTLALVVPFALPLLERFWPLVFKRFGIHTRGPDDAEFDAEQAFPPSLAVSGRPHLLALLAALGVTAVAALLPFTFAMARTFGELMSPLLMLEVFVLYGMLATAVAFETTLLASRVRRYGRFRRRIEAFLGGTLIAVLTLGVLATLGGAVSASNISRGWRGGTLLSTMVDSTLNPLSPEVVVVFSGQMTGLWLGARYRGHVLEGLALTGPMAASALAAYFVHPCWFTYAYLPYALTGLVLVPLLLPYLERRLGGRFEMSSPSGLAGRIVGHV
jgi:hypothetical protein